MLMDKIRGLVKQASEETDTDSYARSTFAEKLMHMVSTSHMWHFKTKSYSKHKAFEDFYEELTDLADKYIEAEMGINGLIVDTDNVYEYTSINSVSEELKSFRLDVSDAIEYQEVYGSKGLVSTLEEVLVLVDSTLYKVLNLN